MFENGKIESAYRKISENAKRDISGLSHVMTACILTAENPFATQLIAEQNNDRNAKLESVLKTAGFQFKRCSGFYENKEKSYVVSNIDLEHAKEISARFNQQSFIFAEKTGHGHMRFDFYAYHHSDYDSAVEFVRKNCLSGENKCLFQNSDGKDSRGFDVKRQYDEASKFGNIDEMLPRFSADLYIKVDDKNYTNYRQDLNRPLAELNEMYRLCAEKYGNEAVTKLIGESIDLKNGRMGCYHKRIELAELMSNSKNV